MKVAIIGAGIVGITTAYELAMDGHEVTVFERRSAAAEEASFASAGMIGAGHVASWAAPAMAGKMLGQLFRRHAPLRLGLPLSGSELAWLWQWRRTCKFDSYLASCARLQQLALYSRHRLQQITAQHQLDYERSAGCLVMLRNEKDYQLLQPGLQVLQEAGVAFTQLDADQVRQIEPALNSDTRFLGALHLPDDEAANCRQFALLLKNQAQHLGVHFKFSTTVAQLDRMHPATLLVAGEDKLRRFDQLVLCAGLASAELLRPLGLSIPMAAVYGYAISAPVRESLHAPGCTLLDERYQVAISRLGHRIRVSGGAEIGGAPARHNPAALQTLYKVLRDWFPGAAQHSGGSVQAWKGARPMLPDGQPIIGNSGRPGLWLNFGHGASSWALSCGSARALADQMAGHAAEIDMEGLGLRQLG